MSSDARSRNSSKVHKRCSRPPTPPSPDPFNPADPSPPLEADAGPSTAGTGTGERAPDDAGERGAAGLRVGDAPAPPPAVPAALSPSSSGTTDPVEAPAAAVPRVPAIRRRTCSSRAATSAQGFPTHAAASPRVTVPKRSLPSSPPSSLRLTLTVARLLSPLLQAPEPLLLFPPPASLPPAPQGEQPRARKSAWDWSAKNSRRVLRTLRASDRQRWPPTTQKACRTSLS